MKRGARYIAQTINLSDPKTCVRPSVQRLVSEDKDFNVDVNHESNYCARPVSIKVCTRKDMKERCPPKVNECSLLPAHVNFWANSLARKRSLLTLVQESRARATMKFLIRYQGGHPRVVAISRTVSRTPIGNR